MLIENSLFKRKNVVYPEQSENSEEVRVIVFLEFLFIDGCLS